VTSELFLHPIFSDSRAGPVSRPSLPATLSQGFRAYVTGTELHFGRLLFRRQLVANLEENQMKKLVSVVVAVGLATAFVSPVLAADAVPTTKNACAKAHMKWDATTKTCSKASM